MSLIRNLCFSKKNYPNKLIEKKSTIQYSVTIPVGCVPRTLHYLKIPSDVSFVQVKDCPKQRSHFELVRRCDKSSGNIFVSFLLVLHFIEFSPFPLFHMRHETNLHCTKSKKFKRDGNLSVHSVVSQLPNTGLSIRSFPIFGLPS